MPRSAPASTFSGVTPRYRFDMSIIGPVNWGTTEASTTPSMPDAAIAARSSRSLTIRPSSSAVRSRAVASRQFRPSVAPSNTPSTMFVFPMSMASSMSASPAARAR